MISSILFNSITGSGEMPINDRCLILKDGESFFKEFDVGNWRDLHLAIVYTLSIEENQSVSGSVNYQIPQTSPESRIWIGMKNENNRKLPLEENSFFIGYGGPAITSSLQVYSDEDVIKIRPAILNSDVGGFCIVDGFGLTGSYSESHSGSIIFSRRVSGSYLSSPYIFFNLNLTRSGSNIAASFSQTEKNVCSSHEISQSIENYFPRYLFPTQSISVPSNILMNGLLIKSPEFGPYIRIHGVAVCRKK